MIRGGRALGAVLVVSLLLLVGGAALLLRGLHGDHDLLRVLGILATVLGLVGLRALSWIRRARLLTLVGRSLETSPPPNGGSQSGRSG